MDEPEDCGQLARATGRHYLFQEQFATQKQGTRFIPYDREELLKLLESPAERRIPSSDDTVFVIDHSAQHLHRPCGDPLSNLRRVSAYL